MPRPLSALALICAALTLAACAPTPLRDVPLVWAPTDRPDFGKADLRWAQHTAIRFQTFRDVRRSPRLIAENLEDAQPKTVTTRDDVGAFVTRHVQRVFDEAGLDTVTQGGDVVLSGEVRQFFVRETSTYQGSVTLKLTLRNAAGKVLWNGTSSGTAEHFGRSYSAENYYQTLSDAVVNAASAVLQNAEFRGALAKARASAGA